MAHQTSHKTSPVKFTEVIAAMDLYTTGNSSYSSGEYEAALQLYTQGLQCHALKDELYVKLLLNRAQCYLRGEKYSEALKDCSMVISTFPYESSDHSIQQLLLKARLRRAQTHEHLGNYAKALADVDFVLELDPPVSLRKSALASRSKLRTFVEVDQKVSLSEGRPKMMVTDQQALRLAFIEQPPEVFVLGESYLVRLCITNELGLWDRDFIRRSFASIQIDTSQGGGTSQSGTAKLESIADMQCTMSVFNLAQASETDNSSSGTEELTNNTDKVDDTVYMEMRTCPSSTNSSPMSIGEDGKIDLYITLRQVTPSFCLEVTKSSPLNHLAVMLRFSLDRPLPSSGEVLPVLSLPARVISRGGDRVLSNSNTFGSVTTDLSDEGRDRSSAYEKVIELCRRVHATCVRQIPLTHTTIAPNTSTHSNQSTKNNSISTSSSTVTSAKDSTFSAYALESPGYLGIAGKVWDSMYVLLQYLAIHQEEFVKGKRIVELGCGTGLAGISLCPMQPASVVLTDMPEVVPLINANILLNSVVMGDAACQQVLLHSYKAKAYSWGGTLNLDEIFNSNSGECEGISGPSESSSHGGESRSAVYKVPYFDTILASDVVYYPEGYAPLLATLCDLLGATDTLNVDNNNIKTTEKKSAPVCILAHRHRHPEDKNFFDALYAVPELHTEKLDFKVQNSGGSEVHALQDVVLFKITKRLQL